MGHMMFIVNIRTVGKYVMFRPSLTVACYLELWVIILLRFIFAKYMWFGLKMFAFVIGHSATARLAQCRLILSLCRVPP